MPLLSSLARRALTAQLARLRVGHLILRDGADVRTFGPPDSHPIVLDVHDPRFYAAVVLGGGLGAGEAYTAGWWAASDLTGVVQVMLRNRQALDGIDSTAGRLLGPLRRLANAVHANTRRGARRNIGAHYDLGNDFFRLFLDETLTYSCGIFDRPGATLAEASTAKYARMAALLDLQPADHVVEIGTGWGGFALHAARHHGCRVTTTTISAEQFALARQRVAEAGLGDRVAVLNADYRDLDGRYDKLVSIEMVEAIGHRQYDAYFRKIGELLKPGGRAAIQAITITDDRYESARREVDFIKRHIFPGSCIPSRAVLAAAAGRAGLRTVQADEIGLHYAETLRRWRMALLGQVEAVEALGLDARFRRLWEFYFCYCEGGFLEQAIGTAQILYTADGVAALPVQAPVVPPAPASVAA